jgi:ribonuclease HII
MSVLVVGIDEVGRGALAGPVVVGAAALGDVSADILRQDVEVLLKRKLADSKKLTAKQREKVATYLQDKVIWGIGEASAADVDEYGLTLALSMAAERALTAIQKNHTIAAIKADAGLKHPLTIPTEHFVKGDETIIEITLASILAKVYRDTLMQKLAETHLGYGWEKNVGYGSAAHGEAIRKLGRTSEHRALFLRKFV